MLPQTVFYFLRHGETDWNHRRVMQGHMDIALNDIGVHQAHAIASAVGALPIKTICCSPLQRARRTAELVNSNHLPLVVIDALKECGFGIYEGEDSGGAWRQAWLAGGEIEGGETRAAYIERVFGALKTALVQPGPVLVVAHGGTFWALDRLARTETRVPNCALFELSPPDEPARPWRVKQIAHPPERSLTIGEAVRV